VKGLLRSAALLAFAALAAGAARAGTADVVAAKVRKTGDTYTFVVTVRHADEGWEHYADAWEVVGPDGMVIAKRVLLHPHVKEQPFTRALAGVHIPEGVTRVTLRAHDKVHGYGGAVLEVEIPR
jgi:hypothetical protein